MSSSDFRQIANGAESGKTDRLFRAAVSAFCALPRPSRREIAQLEDLALPLFDSVSAESRRFVAAVLSEVPHAPRGLVRRLCDEPVGVSAPLLTRSTVLSDIDLIALIGRHGLPHARAIARRRNLNPTIADLVKALERPPLVKAVEGKSLQPKAPPEPPAGEAAPAAPSAVPADTAAESVRRRLRGMMLPGTGDEAGPASDLASRDTRFAKLRATALTGRASYFQTALAELLGIDFRQARAITNSTSYADLILSLRALDLEPEQAFLLAAALFPTSFGHTEAIRLFLDRYRLTHGEAARERLREWKAAKGEARLADKTGTPRREDPDPDRPAEMPAPGVLKAS